MIVKMIGQRVEHLAFRRTAEIKLEIKLEIKPRPHGAKANAFKNKNTQISNDKKVFDRGRKS